MVDVILNAAETIAREWRALAIAWHVAAAGWLAFIFTGHATNRTSAAALTMPMISVAALAWWSGNPFNALLFAAAACVLLPIGLRCRRDRVRRATGWEFAAGAALCVFGWSYPHFLQGAWWRYLFEAPLGRLPCATLAFLIGATLIVRNFTSRAWTAVVLGLGVIYGATGVFVLGVAIDRVLLAGAVLLAVRRLTSHIEQPYLTELGRTS